MKANIKIVYAAVVLGLVAGILTLLIPIPDSRQNSSLAFHFSLSANTLSFLLHLGAALLSLMSLDVYKDSLRRAYAKFAAGIVLIAVGVLQLPVLDAVDGWQSAYVTSGLFGLPHVVGSLLIYLGVARFAKLIGSKHIFTRQFFLIPIVILLSGLASFIPHTPTDLIDELSLDIILGIQVWSLALLFASSAVFFDMKLKIGKHYKTSVLYAGIAAFSSGVCLAVNTVDTLFIPMVNGILFYVLNVIVVVAGAAWLKAGYELNRTKDL